MYFAFLFEKKNYLALSQNMFKIYFTTRRPTSIYYIFERKIVFLNSVLAPEGGDYKIQLR